MRLIDADALMEHVYRDRLDSRERIAQMIKNAPTIEPEQRWIPCSERLPEEGLNIVTFSDGDVELLWFPTAYRKKDIVAWMPPPEPYKEDNT